MKLAAGGLAGASVLSSKLVDDADAATSTVDLGEQGLTQGDVIDDYLSEHLQSGTEVRVPEGEYEWQGSGLDGSYDGAALVGNGEITLQFSGDYWNASIFAVGGGNFAIRNVTIRGPIESNDNKSRLRFDARHPDSTITLDNFNLPDGDVGQGRAIGIYVGYDHQGTVHVHNCHVEHFPNNGLYAGSYGRSGGGGGRVVVEHSLFKNNNIDGVRLGGTNDVIRNCVIVQKEVPAYHDGAKSGRGLRIRYPGDDITVENVHVTSSASVPFLVPQRSEGPSGQVSGLCIENDTGTTAAVIETGSWTADSVHVTGSGNRNVTGFEDVTDLYTGENAEQAASSLSGVGGSSSGSTGGSSDSSTSGGTDSPTTESTTDTATGGSDDATGN